jgi:hypothetical protein
MSSLEKQSQKALSSDWSIGKQEAFSASSKKEEAKILLPNSRTAFQKK